MAITFKFLKAGKGDAILISVEGRNILVDGSDNYENLYRPLSSLKENKQSLDLVILTHLDDDHIKGLVNLLGDKKNSSLVKKIWFNSCEQDNIFRFDSNPQISTRNLIKFNDLVRKLREENPIFTYDDCLHTEKYSTLDIFEDTSIRLLSPTWQTLSELHEKYADEKEQLKKSQSNNISSVRMDDQKTLEEFAQEKFEKDKSVSNGSSLAFILTYKKEHFLLLGDAHINVITNSLVRMGYSKENKLAVQLVKLSHHGSKNNIHQDFLELIDADTFIISTNGAGTHHHPDAATLGKVILNSSRNRDRKINFKFNYEEVCRRFSKMNAFEEDNRKQYNFSLTCLGDNGLTFGS